MNKSSHSRGLVAPVLFPPESSDWKPRQPPIEPLIKPVKRSAVWLGALGLVGFILSVGASFYCSLAATVC